MPNFKPELSKKNPYCLSKYRFYELKYFCLQYPEWKKRCKELEMKISRSYDCETVVSNVDVRPVEDLAIEKERLWRQIKMVEDAAALTDESIGRAILRAVTEGYSFTEMKMVYEVPCERDMWYSRYRKFFWILSRKLQGVK